MPFQEASLPGGGDREAAKGRHWAGGARGGIESRCRGPGTPVRAGLNSQAPRSEGGWERGPAGWAWSPAPRNWERDTSRATWKPPAYGSLGGKTQQGTGDCPGSLLPGLCELLLNGSSSYPGMAREGKCDRSFYRWGNGGLEKLTYDLTTNDCDGARRHWEGGTQGPGRVSRFLCPSGQGDLNQLAQLTGGKYHPCRRPWLTEARPADTGQAGMSRADPSSGRAQSRE